jgi:hypothetical protein
MTSPDPLPARRPEPLGERRPEPRPEPLAERRPEPQPEPLPEQLPDLLCERRTSAVTHGLDLAAAGPEAASAGAPSPAAAPVSADEVTQRPQPGPGDDEPAALVQLRSAPALEPPYDGEGDPGADCAAWPAVLTPELPFEARHTYPPDTGGGPSMVPARRAAGGARPRLPDARTYSERLVRAIIEVIGRRRPLQQLMPLATTEVYAQVNHLQRWIMREGRVGRSMLVTLRSVRASQPAADVAEVSAVVTIGERSYAAVLRLEILDERWLCTLLHLL